MKPLLLYNNVLINASLSATSTATGYDVDNIADYRTHTFWKSAVSGTTIDIGITIASQAVDTFGIVGHNLGTAGATLQVRQGSTVLATKIPLNDDAFMLHFNAVTNTSFTIRITGSTQAVYAAVIFLGMAVEFDVYADTPVIPYVQLTKTSSNKSKSGYLLGTVIESVEYQINHSYSNFSLSWFNTYIKPFINNHAVLQLPFFYCRDLTNNPDEAFYCWFPEEFQFQHVLSNAYRGDNFQLNMVGIK